FAVGTPHRQLALPSFTPSGIAMHGPDVAWPVERLSPACRLPSRDPAGAHRFDRPRRHCRPVATEVAPATGGAAIACRRIANDHAARTWACAPLRHRDQLAAGDRAG